MSVMDLFARKIQVTHEGRIFDVSRPTVETVLYAVTLFRSEIAEYLTQSTGHDLSVDQHVNNLCAIALVYPARLIQVLNTCIVSRDGHPITPSATRGLLRALLGLCDPVRIVSTLDLNEFAFVPVTDEQTVSDASEPDLMQLNVCKLAMAFHISPLEVVMWPYEAVVAVNESLRSMHGKKPDTQHTGTIDDLAKMPGFGCQ